LGRRLPNPLAAIIAPILAHKPPYR
jgi:hypothetical protein